MKEGTFTSTAVVGIIGGLLMVVTLFMPWSVLAPDSEIDLSNGTGILLGNALNGSLCAGEDSCQTGDGASYSGSDVGVSYIALFGIVLGGLSLMLAYKPEKNLAWILFSLVLAVGFLVAIIWSGEFTSGPNSDSLSAGVGFKLGLVGYFMTMIAASRFVLKTNEDTKGVLAATGAVSTVGYLGLALAVIVAIFA